MNLLTELFNNSTYYGDILAIPFFALGVYYFYSIKKKTKFEYILLLACVLGLILDTIFTIKYFNNIILK
jgi:hypothetical protein